MSNIKREFSKNAIYYDSYNLIQKEVASHLLKKIKTKPLKIIDIGAGSGEIFKQLDWKVSEFIALDFSKDMCSKHPIGSNVKVIIADFNEYSTYSFFKKYNVDYIISSSALQWAKNLDWVFENIALINKPVALALFTSNTFLKLHQKIKINSPLYSKDDIVKSAENFFDAKIEIKNFKIEFSSTRKMFEYIKKSGVSGGEKKAHTAILRKLIKDNELRELEAEVVFIYS
ncbi:MAG: malonyl-CoA O-methyltransferase [Campylobacterota bacterium]|nr:malonyl-CoA O-methyltransferase [Campylobacterota bacterium]